MDIEEARRRLAVHPPKGDPTNIAFGETLAEKAARLDAEQAIPVQHQPRRGDAVEVWLKAQRDGCVSYPVQYEAADGLLDLYRLHADTGTPLDQGVSDGGPDA